MFYLPRNSVVCHIISCAASDFKCISLATILGYENQSVKSIFFNLITAVWMEVYFTLTFQELNYITN